MRNTVFLLLDLSISSGLFFHLSNKNDTALQTVDFTMNSTCNSLLVLTLVVASAHALSLFGQKRRMESVVRKYFDGVNKKDPDQIRSCFGEEAVIRDVVVSDAKRTVKSQILADRCMDFLTAHPDCKVDFYYG
jgi:hypothetical protein